MEPSELTADPNSLQQRKSVETRTAILEGAIECLSTHGYANTTVRLISEVSGVTRGAMSHHYASRLDLIAAVIDYAVFKLIESFDAAISSMDHDHRKQMHEAVQIDWDLYASKEYRAYFELISASRHEEDLRSIFLPQARKLNAIRRQVMEQNFPEWEHRQDRLTVGRGFAQAMAAGMVVNREIWDDPKLEKSLLHLMAAFLIQIRDGVVAIDPPRN